ncbi:MAG: APC family permease [Dehalococcoidales bacterium]|nr:APC family permease [Dehalococcoidales bacterium]
MMKNGWLRKPGDRIIHPRRIPGNRLKRVLGVAAVFSAGYGNVGSSIYYALGIVALAACGATPAALGAAGILFIFTALTYAEGTSMMPEAGGSAVFSMRGFNRVTGFVAGWALLLSYIATISMSAFTIPPYLGFFWEPLKELPLVGTGAAIGIILLLMLVNVIGVRETSVINVAAAILDITTQITLIVIGFILLYNPVVLFHRIADNWPSMENFVLGIALASIAYTGIETASQMAEETRLPEKRVPKAIIMMIFAVLAIFAGISLVSFIAMSPQELGTVWARDPVAGIASKIPIEMLSTILKPLIGILAGSILLIATNAGLIGISRLAFSLGQHDLAPKAFSRVHPRFHTPYLAIILFSLIGILILIPGFFSATVFENVGALYAFGSLMAFTFSHASILALRIKEPDTPRPFRLRWNIRIRGYQLPITAILGLCFTFTVWLIIVISQPYSRWLGIGWMAIGLVLYWLFIRRSKNKVMPDAQATIDKQ